MKLIGGPGPFPNGFSPLVNVQLAKEIIAKSLEISVTELDVFIDKIRSVKHLDDVKLFTIVKEAKIEVDCQVGSEIKESGPVVDHQARVSQNANIETPKLERPKKASSIKKAMVTPVAGDRRKNVKQVPVKKCRFVEQGKPCPFGKSCRFLH